MTDAVLSIRLAALEARLAALEAQQVPASPPTEAPITIGEADRYVTIPQVAKRTGLSVSFLYELARRGNLPVRPMGTGRRPRGYRVLLSELLAWEAGRKKTAVADRVNNMLTSSHDR